MDKRGQVWTMVGKCGQTWTSVGKYESNPIAVPIVLRGEHNYRLSVEAPPDA